MLVIGATGRHGGTGARVVERLQAAGRLVRALVRCDDERAQRLRESGVQTLVGDLHDRRTLLPALDGAGSVYVAYPVAAGTVDALANVASVIRELGSSPHVVMNGNGAADHNAPSGFARAHALAEELLLAARGEFHRRCEAARSSTRTSCCCTPTRSARPACSPTASAMPARPGSAPPTPPTCARPPCSTRRPRQHPIRLPAGP